MLLACVLLLIGCSGDRLLERGERVPNFSADQLDGSRFYFYNSIEKTLILFFYATWDQDSQAMLATLRRIAPTQSKLSIACVAARTSDRDALREIEIQQQLPFSFILDSSGRISEHFGVRKLPVVFLISPSAQVLRVYSDASPSTLREIETDAAAIASGRNLD
ncbi:MAG: redoxin domain-containing protein [Candidatus Alcyoniella australis]|nr:redoxin domain-containing protein [Candidatus Alcyoniella australis]